MKEIKSYLIILIVLVFLSLSVVSAANNGLNEDLNESDVLLASSASNEIPISSELDSSHLDDASNDLNESEGEIQSDDASKADVDSSKSGGDSSKSDLKLGSADNSKPNYESSLIVINQSTYADYFNSSNGAILDGSIKDGDTIKIESISDALFVIDKQVTIISDSDAVLTDCLIRLVKGSSNSQIKGLTIINTKEKLSGL